MTSARTLALAAVLAAVASPAKAQLGEAQFGIVASYGPGRTEGPTGGFVVGVAAGRLIYIGMRATRHGETRTMPGPAAGSTSQVTNRATVVATDVAAVIPAGPLEVMAGLSLGVVHQAQRVVPSSGGGTAAATRGSSTELLAAPSLSAELHAGPVALIPEVQFQFSGQTVLPYPVRRIGWLFSLRLVVPVEVGRIRS